MRQFRQTFDRARSTAEQHNTAFWDGFVEGVNQRGTGPALPAVRKPPTIGYRLKMIALVTLAWAVNIWLMLGGLGVTIAVIFWGLFFLWAVVFYGACKRGYGTTMYGGLLRAVLPWRP